MDVHPLEGESLGKAVWNQKGVLKGQRYRGEWKLEAASSGTYVISLGRWPVESKLAFGDVPNKGEPVVYKEARLNVGDGELVLPIDMKSTRVTFNVRLEKGTLDMDAVLVDTGGQISSAYYVEVKRLE
jgi:hypothetical protein